MISAKVSGYTVDMSDAIDRATSKAILKACIDLANQMKALAPVDKGRLKNSVQWKTTAGEGGLNDSGGERESEKIDETPSLESGFAGATANYAIYVERGRTAKNGRKMPAQPFAEPSVDLVFNGAKISELAAQYGMNLAGMAERGKRTMYK